MAPLLLRDQYRMHPALADFPSGRFYASRLRSAVTAADRPPPKGVRWPNATCAAAFIDVAGEERLEQPSQLIAEADATASGGGRANGAGGGGSGGGAGRSGGSYCNAREATALVDAVRAVLARGELSPRELGVITPYAAQAALISKKLQRLPASLGAADVEVSSVDGFQVSKYVSK